MKGSVIVISGPSGAGKSTVVRLVTQMRDDFYFSVSATTRGIREGEIPDVSYRFISQEAYDDMVARDEFLEHAGYAGNSYGTPARPVYEALEQGKTVILDIDVQGARQIKEKLPDALLIFLTPSHLSDVRKRLIQRGTETEKKIEERLEKARWEVTQLDFYDYIVINDEREQAARELDAIITASRCRCAHRAGVIDTTL